jgi:hypothetical protein
MPSLPLAWGTSCLAPLRQEHRQKACHRAKQEKYSGNSLQTAEPWPTLTPAYELEPDGWRTSHLWAKSSLVAFLFFGLVVRGYGSHNVLPVLAWGTVMIRMSWDPSIAARCLYDSWAGEELSTHEPVEMSVKPAPRPRQKMCAPRPPGGQ